jgi:hypothetical protein
MFKDSLRSVVPVGATIYFAYAISLVFKEVAMADAIQAWVTGFGLSKFGWVILIVLFTGILGMVMPVPPRSPFSAERSYRREAVGIDPFLWRRSCPRSPESWRE